MTVGDFFLILDFDRISLIVFHVFFMSKMNDAAVPLHLPGVVTLNSESETG